MRWVAALTLVGLLVVLVLVIRSVRPGESEQLRGPFDPTTTDPAELRRVTEAVSRVISAPPAQHEAAVQTLESVRADSPGARDLKEACVNTYRGMILAEQWLDQLRGILVGPDGGMRPAETIDPAARARGMELDRQVRNQIELVNQSRHRCHDLYEAAARRFGMVPARRPALEQH